MAIIVLSFIAALVLCVPSYSSASRLYRVKDTHGLSCILADMDVSIIVSYPSQDKTVVVSEKIDFANLPSSYQVTTTGHCLPKDGSLGRLAITIATPVEHIFSVAFKRANGTVYLQSFSFAYSLNDSSLFPNAMNLTNSSRLAIIDFNDKALSSDSTYFSCRNVFQGQRALTVKDHERGIDESVSLQLLNVRLQAYGVANDAFTGNGQPCPGDASRSAVAPPDGVILVSTGIGIVAGVCTLAGIAVIAFVAFATIKRMRRRRTSYRPML